jgi:hypothetical protein
MTTKFHSVLQLFDRQCRAIVLSTQKVNNAGAAIRTRRKQTKRSVGSTRILGIPAIDLAIVADEECFCRRYKTQGRTMEASLSALHIYFLRHRAVVLSP